eukprot:Clim_evm32s2 gene=Clim_evmTU32s2
MVVSSLGRRCATPFVTAVLFLQLMICSLSFFDSQVGAVIAVTEERVSFAFQDLQASLGPAFPEDGLTGFTVVPQNLEGCTPIDVHQLKDKESHSGGEPGLHHSDGQDRPLFFLLIRGGCAFATKIINAQNAGADAVIVADNIYGPLLTMYDRDELSHDIHIPSVFVSKADGVIIRRLATHTTLFTLNNNPQLTIATVSGPFIVVVVLMVLIVVCYAIARQRRAGLLGHGSRAVLTESILRRIPMRYYQKHEFNTGCSICLDDFEEEEQIRMLPCGHEYHVNCVDHWLTTRSATCPICKRDLIATMNNTGTNNSNCTNCNSRGTTPTGIAPTAMLQVNTNGSHTGAGYNLDILDEDTPLLSSNSASPVGRLTLSPRAMNSRRSSTPRSVIAGSSSGSSSSGDSDIADDGSDMCVVNMQSSDEGKYA